MSELDRIVAELRARRLALRMTQREVAAASGISVEQICSYETRRIASPSLARLVAWADALGCDVTITVRPGAASHEEGQP